MGIVGALLVLLPQVLVYFVHSAMLLVGKEERPKPRKPGNSKNISFIVPVRKEPLNYIEEAVKYVGSLGVANYEVIVVSDDDEQLKEELFGLINRLRNEGFNVWIIWRSVPRGLRTGALNFGLYASIGDFIYVLDVDSRPEKCFFVNAIEVLEGCRDCIGATGRWEPLNADSRVSEALALGLKFLARVLYRARDRVGLFVYPLGTGTLYKSRLLKEVLGGWDESKIQDDMEIGTRIMYSGFRVAYIDECAIYVENPSSYRAFRIQQSRWAYGAMDVAMSNIKYIFRSRHPLLVRIEAYLYLLQYLPQSLVFIGTTMMCISQLICPADSLKDLILLAILWIAGLSSYSILMIREAFSGKRLWDFIVLAGRLSAFSTTVSPYVAFYSVKALLRFKETYQRTPKGIYQKIHSSTRFPWELVLGVLITAVGLRAFFAESVITALWLISMGSAYLYTTYRCTQDVFYD